LYFGSRDFGFVTTKQIRLPFEEFREELSKQTVSKKYLPWFEKAIPEAEAELSKPKEDRMFIERPKKKRASSSSSRRKSVAPAKSTPKKPTAKAPRPEPDEEEEVSEEEEGEGDEAEDEEAEIDGENSDEESEAEFDASPKASKPSKREKGSETKKEKKKSITRSKPVLSTAQLVDKYRVKSHPEGASKKVWLPLPHS
jgi:cobalamin biosynthesis protein CobT